MHNAADEQLLIWAAQGRKEALEEIYRRHHKRLGNFLLRLCRNRETAADLLQELFLFVWRRAAHYEPRAKATVYLYRNAYHLWQKSGRRRTETAWTNLDAGHSPDTAAPSRRESPPEERLLAAERQDIVRRCLEDLPEGERAVIHLSEFEGMDYRQIGEVLGIPVGTVKSRRFYATQRLREALADFAQET